MPNHLICTPLKLSLSGLTLRCGEHGIYWGGFDSDPAVKYVSVLIPRNEINIVKYEGNQFCSLQTSSGCVRFDLTEVEASWLCEFYKQDKIVV